MKDEERVILDRGRGPARRARAVGRQSASFTLDSQEELAAAYRHLRDAPIRLCPHRPLRAFRTGPTGGDESRPAGRRHQKRRAWREYAGREAEIRRVGGPEDPADIARGLLETVTDEGMWSRYREAGIRRVVSRYTWERTAEGYLATIEAIVGQEHRADELPIPAYFTHSSEETDISLAGLGALYFDL